MALEHVQPAQAIDVRPLGSALAQTKSTAALFKSEQLEVLRIVLHKGQTLPSHQVPGEITLQCIEGVVDVQSSIASADEQFASCRGGCNAVIWPRPVPGTTTRLQAGDLMYLPGDAPHALTALEDASVLVTIVLPARSEKAAAG
ncbi:MAG: hypothetical protein Q4A28_05685 [Brachymonas sp.]|nr:hypothetical protein [Brachymonas sp.]